MNAIELKLNNAGRGAFVIEAEGTQLAEMEIAVQKEDLIVYHTEVAEALQGKGVAGQLLDKMITYAKENKLKVVPLCPYVHAQFKRHPEKYNDIWNKSWHA